MGSGGPGRVFNRCTGWWVWTAVIVTTLTSLTRAFNIDTGSPRVHTGSTGSMFGYAVAQDGPVRRILVGAPRASTTQPGLDRPGAVYACSLDGRSPCRPLVFDDKGNDRQANTQLEEKSNQWFGSSVVVSRQGRVTVACAPRYSYFGFFGGFREPVGVCYVLKTPPATKVSPCTKDVDYIQDPDQYARKSKAQYGMSVALSEDGNTMAVGAVGVYSWQGQVFFHDTSNTKQSFQTDQGTSPEYSYMGYSLAAGHFNGDGTQDYAVGSPREHGLKGMVTLFSSRAEKLFSTGGVQMGEYFGYSLAVGDFNGDRLDDIAVGAPFYAETGTLYETGRVYVYYQSLTLGLKQTVLSGSQHAGARFGLAVTSLGDSNQDGYDDVAVGAPYGGDNGDGTVSIFYGSAKGVRSEPSQVISPSTLGQRLFTFGWSISGGVDLDNNGYPDLVIGAYRSDSSVYLRSRPVVSVQADITITPNSIDLKDPNPCTLTDLRGRRFTANCVNVKTCLEFTGKGVPPEIELSLFWELDPRENSASRLIYREGNMKETKQEGTVRLRRGAPAYCVDHSAFVKPTIRDKLSPLRVVLTYHLLSSTHTNDQLNPVLDSLQSNQVTALAHISADCGSDNVCVPDLQIMAETLTPEFVLGTRDSLLEVYVAVENVGEDAFLAQVGVYLPPGTNYVNVINEDEQFPAKCSARQEKFSVICDIGNPLSLREMVEFTLQISASKVEDIKPIEIHVQSNSSNPEREGTIRDNIATVRIPVKTKATLLVSGVSDPEQVSYNSSSVRDKVVSMPGVKITDVGPEVVHLYEVRNLGPSPLTEVSVDIWWPSYLEDGGDLLYLTALPHLSTGTGVCTADGVNRHNLNVSATAETTSRKRRSTHKHGMVAGNLTDSTPDNSLPTKELVCTSASPRCVRIHCITHLVRRDENILIQVKSRLWLQSVVQLPFRALIVSSQAVAGGATGLGHAAPKSAQVDTYIAASDARPERGSVAVWIVVVAVLCGLLLLVILMAGLYKCGFFKRNRPQTGEDVAAESEGAAGQGVDGPAAGSAD